MAYYCRNLLPSTQEQHRMEYGPPCLFTSGNSTRSIRGDIPECRYLPNIGRSILLRVDLGTDGPTSPPALHHGVGGRGGDFILPRVCTAACFLQVLDLLCLLLKNHKFIKWDPPSVLFTGIFVFYWQSFSVTANLSLSTWKLRGKGQSRMGENGESSLKRNTLKGLYCSSDGDKRYTNKKPLVQGHITCK